MLKETRRPDCSTLCGVYTCIVRDFEKESLCVFVLPDHAGEFVLLFTSPLVTAFRSFIVNEMVETRRGCSLQPGSLEYWRRLVAIHSAIS